MEPVLYPAHFLAHYARPHIFARRSKHDFFRWWLLIKDGWDLERPAVAVKGRVLEGTHRLSAALQFAPEMLVPLVCVATSRQMGLYALPHTSRERICDLQRPLR